MTIGVRELHFRAHVDTLGSLFAYEQGGDVPFELRRVFAVTSTTGTTRGDHAHKRCTQLLICAAGAIRVTCDDGSTVSEHLLDNLGVGLLVPPGIWSAEEYLMDGAVLVVLCDRVYEADDYIRDYSDFKAFRDKMSEQS